ncbi:MAG: class I SAM-dependent methyltransferase [Candidatus Hodarchaeota archaeon]
MNNAFGASLIAYWQGNSKATHIIQRDDGYKEEIAVEYLFRESSEWEKEELQSLSKIPPNSTILDVGCGVGRIAIYLQNKGHKVVGFDSCPEALEIAQARGLESTILGNICELENPPLFNTFDAILMMGNNFGICGDIPKTKNLIKRFQSLLSPSGQLIFSCRDPLNTKKPEHLTYHDQNRKKGRPPGLVKIRICFQTLKDEWWDLLFADVPSVKEILISTGYTEIAIYQDPSSPIFYVVAQRS